MLLLLPPAHSHLAQLVDGEAAIAASHHCVCYRSVQQARVPSRLSNELRWVSGPGGDLLELW